MRADLEKLFAEMEKELANTTVVSPFDPQTEGRQISPDGTIAYAEVNLADRDSTQYEKAATKARTAAGFSCANRCVV